MPEFYSVHGSVEFANIYKGSLGWKKLGLQKELNKTRKMM